MSLDGSPVMLLIRLLGLVTKLINFYQETSLWKRN